MGPSLARDEPGGERHPIRPVSGADVIPLRPSLPASVPSSLTDQQVAAWWESIFQDMGRTLTDEQTAEAHRVTSAGFGLLIDGARAAGVLTESQAEYLSAMAVEAVRAPDFVARRT
ncbi:hypothetical protein [Streptomyces sp. NPDC058084]|uniref:hypothetical protein n=1 Tax=Streptomyces sp. NPDC058084 TaxID=3346333 RepID=UPI0036E27494